jgi:hypothetical protein
MRRYLVIVGVCAGGSMFSGAAHAQSEASDFCTAAGAYMREIAVRRSGGATSDEAVGAGGSGVRRVRDEPG